MASYDIQLAFTDNHCHICLANVPCSFVQTKKLLALAESHGFCRVDIFAGVLVILHHTPGKANHFTTHIVNGEHEPISKDRVFPATPIAQKICFGEKLRIQVFVRGKLL